LGIGLLDQSKLSSGTARVLVGVMLAVTASFVSAKAFAGSELGNALPLWFILVLFLLARRYGFAVGVIGSLLCAFVFAHFLFDPTGSWHVQDEAARRNLLWMIVGAITVSYLLTPSGSESKGSD
jgi:K+-sensing histidine kinase KdpD